MKRTRSNPSASVFRESSNLFELGRRKISAPKPSYERDLWPKIASVLDEIFSESIIVTGKNGMPKKFQDPVKADKCLDFRSSDSYESSYRLVYSCVTHLHGEKLANDLFRKVSSEIQRISAETGDDDAAEFILKFYAGVVKFLRAFSHVEGIFLYFNRHFLIPKMGFQVETELTKLLKALFFDIHGKKLLSLLSEFVAASDEPDEVYNFLVKSFRQISPELLAHYPELDARFSSGLSVSFQRDSTTDSETIDNSNLDENNNQQQQQQQH